jgi:selenide,water dikinase
MKGAYLWGVKDWIDRRFMRKYSSDLDFSVMAASGGAGGQRGPTHGQLTPEVVAVAAAAKMRCGGCGSKVGASTLGRVLQRLRRDEEEAGTAAGAVGLNGGGGSDAVLVGLDSTDDAAVLQAPPPGHVLVHSIDFFRALVDDPFLFGRIAANHALSDIHAMGEV